MADEKKFSLALIIKAVDKATGPLRQINSKIDTATAPMRVFGKELSKFGDLTGITKLGGAFKSFGASVRNVGGEAVALGAKIAGMAAAAGFALFKVMKGAVDAGDKLSEMAQRTGLTVDAYAQLSFAAGQADVEQEDFNAAMDQFNKRLGEAKAGTGGLLSFLKKVSPVLASQVKGAKSTEEAFDLMTLAFEKVTDPGKRAALSAAAFGKSSLQMGQFMGQGVVKINEMRGEFFKLNGSQQKFADGASEADNALKKLDTAFGGLRNAAAAELFPALTMLAGALTNVLAGNRERLAAWAQEASASILAWVQGGGIDRLVAGFKDIALSVSSVIDMIGGFKGVAIGIAAFMAGPFLASVAGLAISFVQLIAAIGGPTAIAAMVGLLGPIAAVTAALVGVGAAIFQVVKHWDDLMLISKEMASSPLEFLSRGFGQLKEDIFGEDRTPARLPEATRPRGGNTQAHVTVDFNNVPPGTRVTPAKGNTAPVDLSVGPSMVTP